MLHPIVAEIREQLRNDTASLLHDNLSRSSGVSVGQRLAALWDTVLIKLWLHESGQHSNTDVSFGPYVLLALGGYGRGIVAPYSDVDLVLLTPSKPSHALRSVSAGFYRDVYDLGWQFGFSAHTLKTLQRQLLRDPCFLTGVLQARPIYGDRDVFEAFEQAVKRTLRRHAGRLLDAIIQARNIEREQFGDTVFILQPNVKRSPGGIRDIQLIHWISRFRECGIDLGDDPAFGKEDLALLAEGEEFLWSIRQWLHCRAAWSHDVLTRSDQWQLATAWGYPGEFNLLPAEVFMREYFRKTERVYILAQQLAECVRAATNKRISRTPLAAGEALIEVEGYLTITEAGEAALARGWDALLELLETSQRLDRPLAWRVWHSVQRHLASFAGPIPREVIAKFATLFEKPQQLAGILRGLHKVRLLERFIPAFEHARGLLQLNQYHHYTVDEHSFRAVEAVTSFRGDPGLLGDTYRRIVQKKILHLALLLHDLGKGLGPDHCEVGREIAREVGRRFSLSDEELEILIFLVGSHLRMNHLALRRDLSDEQLVVQFAAEVGSPEVLQMLYVTTAADLMAVSPSNWTAWKADLLAELFQRTARYISDSGDIILRETDLEERRRAVAAALKDEAALPFFRRQLRELPGGLLLAADVASIAADLRWLASLGDSPVEVRAEYRPQSGTLLWNIATRESVAKGIFHRLTGALTSQGLEILAAQIYTLADGWILDKYVVRDPFHEGPPPPERIENVEKVIRNSLTQAEFQPVFVRRWQIGRQGLSGVPPARVRVEFDNHSHDEFTIVEVFANDRPGLLYEISRFFFQEGCFIWRAKIGTFLDQVVDVFYVTDQDREKITSGEKLARMRRGLLAILQTSASG